jgi:hypothetical protein
MRKLTLLRARPSWLERAPTSAAWTSFTQVFLRHALTLRHKLANVR